MKKVLDLLCRISLFTSAACLVLMTTSDLVGMTRLVHLTHELVLSKFVNV